jgi:hypothetical protein
VLPRKRMLASRCLAMDYFDCGRFPQAFCNIEMMETVLTGTAVTIENKLGDSITPC